MVVVDSVVRAPHPRVGGNSQQQFTARLHETHDCSQRLAIVGNMLEDVEQRNKIIFATDLVGDFGKLARPDGAAETLTCQRTRIIVKFDRLEFAIAPEHLEIVSCATAKLENSRTSRKPHFAFDQRGHYFPSTDVPPMSPIQLCHSVECLALHPIPRFSSERHKSAGPLSRS